LASVAKAAGHSRQSQRLHGSRRHYAGHFNSSGSTASIQAALQQSCRRLRHTCQLSSTTNTNTVVAPSMLAVLVFFGVKLQSGLSPELPSLTLHSLPPSLLK